MLTKTHLISWNQWCTGRDGNHMRSHSSSLSFRLTLANMVCGGLLIAGGCNPPASSLTQTERKPVAKPPRILSQQVSKHTYPGSEPLPDGAGPYVQAKNRPCPREFVDAVIKRLQFNSAAVFYTPRWREVFIAPDDLLVSFACGGDMGRSMRSLHELFARNRSKEHELILKVLESPQTSATAWQYILNEVTEKEKFGQPLTKLSSTVLGMALKHSDLEVRFHAWVILSARGESGNLKNLVEHLGKVRYEYQLAGLKVLQRQKTTKNKGWIRTIRASRVIEDEKLEPLAQFVLACLGDREAYRYLEEGYASNKQISRAHYLYGLVKADPKGQAKRVREALSKDPFLADYAAELAWEYRMLEVVPELRLLSATRLPKTNFTSSLLYYFAEAADGITNNKPYKPHSRDRKNDAIRVMYPSNELMVYGP